MKHPRDWEIWTPNVVKSLEKWWKPHRSHDFVASILPRDYRNVLDVGCGIGMFYDLLTKNDAAYFGIDNSDAMLSRAKEKFGSSKFGKGDIYNLNFHNESFDLVFCWCVLFHLPHIDVPIEELCRVSKKYVIFNIWSSKERNALTRGGWNEYIAEYTEEYVQRILEDQSYDVELIPHTLVLDNGKVENWKGRPLSRKVFVLTKKEQLLHQRSQKDALLKC